jgi:hypothetical protein
MFSKLADKAGETVKAATGKLSSLQDAMRDGLKKAKDAAAKAAEAAGVKQDQAAASPDYVEVEGYRYRFAMSDAVFSQICKCFPETAIALTLLRLKPIFISKAKPVESPMDFSPRLDRPVAKGVHLNAETGWCSVPKAGKNGDDGASVWVFFEGGDVNKPIYFASAQSGPGWFSEHPNQHVFKSDNVMVRID